MHAGCDTMNGRLFINISCVLTLLFILNGCSKPQTIGFENKSGQITEKKERTNDATQTMEDGYIKISDVKWITKTGGLPLFNKRFKVLVPQRDYGTIEKIINLVNSATNRRNSTKEEEESLLYDRPRAIEIGLEDGSIVNLWPMINIIKKETPTGTGYTGTRYNDRFILNTQKDGEEQFVTVFSKDVTSYILVGSNTDIPLETVAADEFVKTTAYVLTNTALYDKPNGKEIRNDITKGRVVTVIDKQDAWTKIVIYTYDTPADNIGWVKSNTITSVAEGLTLIEGRLNDKYVLMDGPPPNGKQLPDTVYANQQLLVEEQRNGWVRAQFAGGLNGWVPEKAVEFVGPNVN